ncbi:facilitated trehalose transporter Tret1-like [Plodia interpunctella]|uniref:facilitated trehalose transporter Tret1-like n=1 Tax=Plodia interpunctella TaxID=58824 RepID=UPI0023689DCA|nr:facilitated trehalose transporter Tret1-like [Plodia interpunctella]XP_053617859.1 facilitated trehalose transporter Tret1-like [Plodia interpunctella]
MGKGHTYVQWIVAFVAEMTLLTYGLQAGWVSPMKVILQSESSPAGRPLTEMEMTWVASAVPLAGVIGVPLFVYIADSYGRKVGVLVMAIMQMCCWIIKLSTTNIICLIIARILAGIPAGGCFQLIPVYVKEISQDNIRGMLVSMFLLMQNLGILMIYAMGSYLGYYTVLWIVLTMSVASVLALIKAPESPSFLVKIGKYEEAAATMAFLRGLDMNHKEILGEVNLLKEDDRHFKSLPDITLLAILKNRSYRTGLLLVVIIITVQAINGNYAMFTYASSVFSESGVTLSPELQSLSIPIVMILGSFTSMSCVDKFGRKVLLTLTFAIITAALISLGTILTMRHQGGSFPNWLPVVIIIVSVWSHAAGVAPMPYVIMSEMFNFQIRAKVLGCVVSYAWFVSFLQLFAFGPAISLIGLHNTMYCFAAVNLVGVFLTLLIVPETKGKSVEEIEKMLAKK